MTKDPIFRLNYLQAGRLSSCCFADVSIDLARPTWAMGLLKQCETRPWAGHSSALDIPQPVANALRWYKDVCRHHNQTWQGCRCAACGLKHVLADLEAIR